MADSESILQLGIEAARAGDKAEARELFRLVTREDASNAQGWLWLAGVAEDRDEKRTALEHVLQIDPNNDLARKGLAALGGGRESGPAAVPPTPPPADASKAAAPPAINASVAAAPLPVAPEVAPAPSARMYDSPEPDQAVPAVTPPDDMPRLTPAFAPDDFDLQDYTQAPQPVASGIDTGSVVVVEDEEPPRRRGFGWLPVALALAALALVAVFAFQRFRDPATAASGAQLATAGETTTAGMSSPDGTAIIVLGGATSGITPTTDTALGAGTIPLTSTQVAAANTGEAPTASPEAADLGASQAEAPVAVTAATASEATNPPAVEQTAAVTGADQTVVIVPPDATVAAPPAEQTQVAQANIGPPADQTTAPGGDQTVVIVPPNATVVPPAAPESQPAPPAAEAPAPPAPAPAPADPATANPAIVPNGSVIDAGRWRFTFPGQKNIATGAYGGGRATRGQYQIVIVQVANNSGQATTIPDGFFVLKDATGQVYDFNRAASVDYLNRWGGPGVAADIGADAQIPSSNLLTSVALLFDIPTDATQLVLFSRDNPSQGFSIR